jgi:hypothetical protein
VTSRPRSLTIVRKRQRRLTGVDQIVLSLSARGLTTGRFRRTSRGVQRLGVAGDGLQDHRPGAGGDDGVDEPALDEGRFLVVLRRPRQHFDHSDAACCRRRRRAQARHRADDRREGQRLFDGLPTIRLETIRSTASPVATFSSTTA